MSLTLINGDGNPRVLASQDADWYASLTGNTTAIMPVNDNLAATVADSNTIEISSGVCITKEGRRVQVDEGSIEEIIIPTGTQGVDTYYIIGFHLYIDEMGTQVAETFCETMESAEATITETTFKEGSSSIYVSLYRVKRSGLLLESVTRICPIFSVSAGDVTYNNTNVGAELTQINNSLTAINVDLSEKQSKILIKSANITFTGQSSGIAYANVDVVELFGTNIRAVLNVAGIAHLYQPYGFCVTNAGSGAYVIRIWIHTGGSSNVTVQMQFAAISS